VSDEERKLIGVMFDAFDKLRRLGWKDAMYAPRGKDLEVIEAGSTGIHLATRAGIGFWIHDADDTYPSSPILFRVPAD
jgi:hypothetical protein